MQYFSGQKKKEANFHGRGMRVEVGHTTSMVYTTSSHNVIPGPAVSGHHRISRGCVLPIPVGVLMSTQVCQHGP